jgi:hypothetical protein
MGRDPAFGPSRAPGRLHRPGGVVGGRLSALVLSAGRLIDGDTREIELVVDLPAGAGRTRQPVKVVGPAAYLASKADALHRRDKNKDAYDIVWLLESWPGGTRAIRAGDSGNQHRGGCELPRRATLTRSGVLVDRLSRRREVRPVHGGRRPVSRPARAPSRRRCDRSAPGTPQLAPRGDTKRPPDRPIRGRRLASEMRSRDPASSSFLSSSVRPCFLA